MSTFSKLVAYWENEIKQNYARPELGQLTGGDFTLGNYRSYLLETYFHTRENPFSQLMITRWLDRGDHALLKTFVSHAASEIKHDQLAVSDLLVAGGSSEWLNTMAPLPATVGLIGYTYYIANLPTPLPYLGYLMHVELLPSFQGDGYIEKLKKKGIPENALTFIEEHSKVDPGHSKLMEIYIASLVKTEEDFQKVQHGIHYGAFMHFEMIRRALERELPSVPVRKVAIGE